MGHGLVHVVIAYNRPVVGLTRNEVQVAKISPVRRGMVVIAPWT